MSCPNSEVRPLYTDLLSENPVYSIVREESNRIESEMDIEASSSKTQDIRRGNFEQMPIDLERGRARKIERGSEKSNMAEFRLFNQQLPFLLFDEEMDINVFCRACQLPVGGLTYTRTSCDILLHKTCVDFPQEIQHPLHDCEDHLILMAQEHSYKCMACDLNCFAFSFHCNSCKFEVDFSCSSIRGLHKSEGPDPKNYKHDSHEHFLGIVYCRETVQEIPDRRSKKTRVRFGDIPPCNACVHPCQGLALGCNECDFHLHFSCANLESTIKHECHYDPLRS